MENIIKRKMISVLFSASIITIIISFTFIDLKNDLNIMYQFMVGIYIVLIFSYIIVTLYGLIISMLLEKTVGRLTSLISKVCNGVLHLLLGASIGIFFHSIEFYYYGGLMAALFYIVDVILSSQNIRLIDIVKKSTYILNVFVVILWFSLLIYSTFEGIKEFISLIN